MKLKNHKFDYLRVVAVINWYMFGALYDCRYWYYNGTLFPDDMCTAFLAVDDIDMENGCLKVKENSYLWHKIYEQ